MKYSYSPEMPPTINQISNSCKVVEYSDVVECEYELCHIPIGRGNDNDSTATSQTLQMLLNNHATITNYNFI